MEIGAEAGARIERVQSRRKLRSCALVRSNCTEPRVNRAYSAPSCAKLHRKLHRGANRLSLYFRPVYVTL